MQKKDLGALLKKLTYSRGADALKMEITPYRDWRIVVVIFFMGLAGSLVFNIYMSIEINQDSFFALTPKSAGMVKFNEEGLAKVVAGLDEKAALSENVRTAGMQIVDPSR